MVTHILRKDIKLLWPAIFGLTVLQVIHFAIGYRLPISMSSEDFLTRIVPYNNFGILCTYATQLLIVLVVQQDALVGTRQDWLMRPIVRRDMLLAKLIFVLGPVRLPVFFCDLVLALHHGAALPPALAAAAFSAFEALFGNDLITFVVAAVTENLLQAIICVLLIAIARGLGSSQIQLLLGGGNFQRTDLHWVGAFLSDWITVLAVAAILLVQFFRRKTFAARTLLSVTVILLVGMTVLPWDTAFALEKFLYSDRTASGAVSIGYAGPQRITKPRQANSFLYLPVHVANIPPHSILRIMNLNLRVMDAGNRQVYSFAPSLRAGVGTFEIPGDETGLNPLQMGVLNPIDIPIEVTAFQSFRLTPEFYRQWKDRPVHLQISYSLALLRQSGVEKIASLGARQKLPGYGLCATVWQSSDNAAVELWCFASADMPSCTTATIETDSGVRDPENYCSPNFEPDWRRLSAPIAPGRTVAGHGLVHFGPTADRYPVKPEDAPRSHFVLTAYNPVAYFNREFNSPEIHLADLAPLFAPTIKPASLAPPSVTPNMATGPACALRQPAVPQPMGPGTIIALEDSAYSLANIPRREARSGGKIDPRYVHDLRAVVRQNGRQIESFDVPPGMTVHVGDRVTLQNSYRNAALPCSYVPILITADLGPAPAPTQTPR